MADNDEIDAKIKEAARILREDGHAVRLGKIEEKLNKHFPDEETETDDDGNPKPPPKKDQPAESETDRKPRHGWWPEGSLGE